MTIEKYTSVSANFVRMHGLRGLQPGPHHPTRLPHLAFYGALDVSIGCVGQRVPFTQIVAAKIHTPFLISALCRLQGSIVRSLNQGGLLSASPCTLKDAPAYDPPIFFLGGPPCPSVFPFVGSVHSLTPSAHCPMLPGLAQGSSHHQCLLAPFRAFHGQSSSVAAVLCSPLADNSLLSSAAAFKPSSFSSFPFHRHHSALPFHPSRSSFPLPPFVPSSVLAVGLVVVAPSPSLVEKPKK